jgi:ribonuclease HI
MINLADIKECVKKLTGETNDNKSLFLGNQQLQNIFADIVLKINTGLSLNLLKHEEVLDVKIEFSQMFNEGWNIDFTNCVGIKIHKHFGYTLKYVNILGLNELFATYIVHITNNISKIYPNTKISIDERETLSDAIQKCENKMVAITDKIIELKNKIQSNETVIIKLTNTILVPRNKTIYIGTDGAASKNGSKNCISKYAFVAIIIGELQINQTPPIYHQHTGLTTKQYHSNSELTSSNNIGELFGILSAAEFVLGEIKTGKIKPDEILNMTIVSDSAYSINAISEWGVKWFSDPKKYKLDEKKNVELIKQCITLVEQLKQQFPVKFIHQRSHINENEFMKYKASATDYPKWLYWWLNNTADKLMSADDK